MATFAKLVSGLSATAEFNSAVDGIIAKNFGSPKGRLNYYVMTRIGHVKMSRTNNQCGKIGLDHLEYLVRIVFPGDSTLDDGYLLAHEWIDIWVNEEFAEGSCEEVLLKLEKRLLFELNQFEGYRLNPLAMKIMIQPNPISPAYLQRIWTTKPEYVPLLNSGRG